MLKDLRAYCAIKIILRMRGGFRLLMVKSYTDEYIFNLLVDATEGKKKKPSEDLPS